MIFLNGQFYVEVKDKRYRIYPTDNIILRERDPPKSLRNHYQVQKNIQIRKNQKIKKNDNNELEVENYLGNKKQPVKQHQRLKFKPINYPICKQNNWLDFDKGFYCRNRD